ncbi:MAG: nucleotidyl transferase AbiEii/AbiGii toxin family protein [Lutibacter sp.]|jgi:predicted nucleotidyltransferase component of viral defense system
MFDINRHKFFMVQILKDIYADIELANYLGFKEGTALMFFYDLPQFSIDLDFNVLDTEKEDFIYDRVRKILVKYGTIDDEAKKHFGILMVLNYGFGERKLKIEISNRLFDDHYEIKNLLGINMNVMVQADMFAHKVCALLDRKSITNRDIFDCWFFMQKHSPINKSIVENRMKMSYEEYLQKCIEYLESVGDAGLLNGLGELMENDMKKFVRTSLRKDTITLLKFYKEFPIV